MDRNLFRRVEACFPISDNNLKKRIISDLDLSLQDNAGAWELQSDGLWTKVQKLPGEDNISSQQALLHKLAEWG